MDNASKALIMAGGVLIAVMIISIAMYMISTARGVAKDVNEQMEASAQESYNRFYQSFGSTIRGIDVLNIYHKVEDDNWRYDSIYYSRNIKINNEVKNTYVPAMEQPNGIEYMDDSYEYSYQDADSDGYIDTITITPN